MPPPRLAAAALLPLLLLARAQAPDCSSWSLASDLANNVYNAACTALSVRVQQPRPLSAHAHRRRPTRAL